MKQVKFQHKIFLSLLLILQGIFSQGKGLLLDEELYVNAPKAPSLTRGDYKNLPPSYSLKKFTPHPGSQGLASTCTGWAAAYGGRTTLASVNRGWSEEETNKNVFSPFFVYNLIKGPTDIDCKNGASMDAALEALQNIGVMKLSEYGNNCESKISDANKKKAVENKIFKYRQIFWDRNNSEYKVICVKKSLSENLPVVVGMFWPFENISGSILNPTEEDYNVKGSAGHALIVVGYDDNLYGGAFEVMNSWGTDWGNGGYLWIRYKDFQQFCILAYELFEQPEITQTKTLLSGSVKLIEKDDKEMILKNFGEFFETNESYKAGTFFRIIVSNNEPAYVYVFGIDENPKPNLLFPYDDKIVAYLPYSQNNVPLPDEDHFYMIDEKSEADYICFVYSKNQLDPMLIINYPGLVTNPVAKIKEALVGKVNSPSEIKLIEREGFSFESVNNEKSMAVFVIKIRKEI